MSDFKIRGQAQYLKNKSMEHLLSDLNHNILSMTRSQEKYQPLPFHTGFRKEIQQNRLMLRFVAHELVAAQIEVASNE